MHISWPLIFLFLWAGCTLNDTTEPVESSTGLTEFFSTHIDVPEPSGLALSKDGKHLWVVSDQTAKVYYISLNGELIRTLNYVGDDLEGVCQHMQDETLWIAEEQRRELVHLDTLGNELDRKKIAVENRSPNSGLEGVTVNSNSGQLFALNEKNPRLFLTLNADFSIASAQPIDFTQDCSGLFYEQGTKQFWLVSDESRKIVRCDSLKRAVQFFRIGVDKAEGIAVSPEDSLIYIVSDSEQKLYWFRMN